MVLGDGPHPREVLLCSILGPHTAMAIACPPLPPTSSSPIPKFFYSEYRDR